MNAANLLKPALSRGEVQVIGATTFGEYRKYIEKDAALERRFQPVNIEQPSKEETISILKGVRSLYEEHHHVNITDEAINAAVDLADRYITDRFLPDKAIDLMDESAAKLRLSSIAMPEELNELRKKALGYENQIVALLAQNDLENAKQVRAEEKETKKKIERLEKRMQARNKRKTLSLSFDDVADTVAQWTGIPVTRLSQSETVRLRNLEKTLHQRVIGQEDAVSAVSRAVRRGRVGLKEPNRPIGSFLFLGPTGVGKTEISKALAEAVFGSENAMIRVDMSEYMEKYSVSKMIGSAPGYVGYEEGGQLSEKVRRHPYSVILFDEIEKAQPDVFNILLQVLDDGHITDSQGRKVDFKNTIIIMTSNAGAQSIVEPKRLGFGDRNNAAENYKDMKSGVMEEVRRLFRPEFLNRIDETIVFRQLTKDDLQKIVKIQISSLVNRCKSLQNITLKIRPVAERWIVDKAYDPKYGARPLRRKIQTELEDLLSEKILAGDIHPGDQVTVGVKNDKLSFLINGK